MAVSLYDQYEFGMLEKVSTTVVSADQTQTLPRGMVTDVMVHEVELCYLVQFLILDYAKCVNNTQPTIITGMSFLAITHTLIDCSNKALEIKCGDYDKWLLLFENATNSFVDKCVYLDKDHTKA